jgi:hypothetical protein
MLANSPSECNFDAARQLLNNTIDWIERASQDGTSADTAEKFLQLQAKLLNHKLLQEFFDRVGPGYLGPTVTLTEGHDVDCWPELQDRRLVTTFGEFTLWRHVYGTRPGQKIELVPTDQRLQLPQSEVSYLLQDWDQKMGTEAAFRMVARNLNDMMEIKQPVDTLERGSLKMAEAAPAFRAAQPAPDPEAEGQFLVASDDNKGVPMVRPAQAAPAGADDKKEQKANKKQMASIGVVYTVDPHKRTPSDVIAALFRDPGQRPPSGPKARQKRYWAGLTRKEKGKLVKAQPQVFLHMATDIALRRKPGQILIHLSDGQLSLETDRNQYLPRDAETVDILDLLHVLPRLWAVAHLFFLKGTDTARRFVRERLPYVLNGNTAELIAEFRLLGIQHGLRGAKAARLKTACRFLENNLHRMKYDEYLGAGYPIATGVIEGACRHVIKDRMERTGMRWKVPGAQAMLELRAISINGDWAEFQRFRIERENNRLYPHKHVVEQIPWPIAA